MDAGSRKSSYENLIESPKYQKQGKKITLTPGRWSPLPEVKGLSRGLTKNWWTLTNFNRKKVSADFNQQNHFFHRSRVDRNFHFVHSFDLKTFLFSFPLKWVPPNALFVENLAFFGGYFYTLKWQIHFHFKIIC